MVFSLLQSPSPAVSRQMGRTPLGSRSVLPIHKLQHPAPPQCHLLLVLPPRRHDRPALRARSPIGQSTRPSYATSPGSGEEARAVAFSTGESCELEALPGRDLRPLGLRRDWCRRPTWRSGPTGELRERFCLRAPRPSSAPRIDPSLPGARQPFWRSRSALPEGHGPGRHRGPLRPPAQPSTGCVVRLASIRSLL